MAQIKVKLDAPQRVNGKTIPAGARQISEADAQALRGMDGVTFIDEQPEGAAAKAPIGEFVIERLATGEEAKRIDREMAAHIEAVKAQEAAPTVLQKTPQLSREELSQMSPEQVAAHQVATALPAVPSPIGTPTSPTSADKVNRPTKPRDAAQGES